MSLERRRRPILNSISFELTPGITALTGPNGAGKSTLVRALAALDEPVSGSVEICTGGDRWSAAHGHYRSHVGYLPQDPEFIGRFTVREALTYGAWLQRVQDVEVSVDRAIADFRLGSEASVQLRRLSGGTRRRALLAMSVVHRPEVVLLDEPTVGMDLAHRQSFRTALERLAEDRIVMVSTHVLGDLGDSCRRILILGGGRLVFDGTPERLAASAIESDGGEDVGFERSIERAITALTAE